ncbi:hypothetical protein Tco_1023261 [Tanacetum coccineum]
MHWKDRFFLIDRHAIPDAMPWRHHNSSMVDPPPTSHVGEHLIFKDGKGNGNVIALCYYKHVLISQVSCIWGVRIGKGTALAANDAIAQHTTAPLPFESQILEKSDYQKVVEHEDERVLAVKRKAHAAKDKVADDSTRIGFGTHHSASCLTTIIPNDTNPIAGGSNLALKSANRLEGDKGNSLDNAKNDTKVNTPYSASSPHFEHSFQSQHSAHSDEHTHANSGGDGLYHDERDEYVRRHASGLIVLPPVVKVISSFPSGTMMVTRRKKNKLLDKIREQEEQIRRQEEALVSKMSSLSEVESAASVLKAIAAGWPKGVEVKHSDEDAESILATTADYDLECKSTFMFPSFTLLHLDSSGASCIPRNIIRHLAIGTWTHPERLAFREILFVTWPLALGLIWSVLRSGKFYSSLGHWHLDSSGASCVTGNIIIHLAIGTWAHPEGAYYQDKNKEPLWYASVTLYGPSHFGPSLPLSSTLLASFLQNTYASGLNNINLTF